MNRAAGAWAKAEAEPPTPLASSSSENRLVIGHFLRSTATGCPRRLIEGRAKSTGQRLGNGAVRCPCP
jgi:hypothetical protein